MDEMDKKVLRKLLDFTNGADPTVLGGSLSISSDKVTLSLEKLECWGYVKSDIILNSVRLYRSTLSGRRYFDPRWKKIKNYFSENWIQLVGTIGAVTAAIAGTITLFKK